MSFIDPKDRGPKCPVCKWRAIKLVPLHDSGRGPFMCRDCKKERRKNVKQV